MDFKVASCRSVTMILAAFPGMVLLPVPVKLGQLGDCHSLCHFME